MIIQMSKFFCDWCERDFLNSSEFSRHQMICDDRSSHKRQKKIDFHQVEFLNVEKELYVQEEFIILFNLNRVDFHKNAKKKKLLQIFMIEKRASLNSLTIEKELYIQEESVILSSVFLWNNHIYKKMIDKKINMIIVIEHEQNLSREENTFFIFNFKYHSFNDEKNYAFVLWFFKNECIKKVVNKFFKNKRLFVVHQNFSFRNENKWLNQIDWIAMKMIENRWFEINLQIKS